jgi:peptide-methionine (S)-S-oxide reductase
MREFGSIYPDGAAFANSTAAARINGYLSGHGTLTQFEEELPLLGLSPEGEKKLREIFERLAP